MKLGRGVPGSYRVVLALIVAAGLGGRARTVGATEPAEPAWTGNASVGLYIVPGDDDFLQPIVFADHRRLHLELRYNYEALETASMWGGYNLHAGRDLSLDLTPMLGLVFGETGGVAPGYEITLAWRRLALFSEGEYVFDWDDSADSFFYVWSTFGVSPWDWLSAGLVGQRTRVYESPRDIQRGFWLGFAYRSIGIQGYVLDPDEDDPLYIVSVGADF